MFHTSRNKSVGFPSYREGETQPGERHERPDSLLDKNTFLQAQDLRAWPPVKKPFVDQGFIHHWLETVLSKTCSTCLHSLASV